MATAEELISWAASQIGVKESPAGSNKVKYWDFYKEHCGKNYQGNPWCAAFVTCGMTTVGLWEFTTDEGRFRYCPSLVNWAKANGTWLDRNEVCKPGDIILFANKGVACHVGFVEKRISSSQVQTIEGNTSLSSNDNGGAVMRRTRTYGTVGSSWYILGFVRPKFTEPKNPTTAYTVLKNNLYVYAEPKSGLKALKKLPKGTVLKITETKKTAGNVWGAYISEDTGKTRWVRLCSENGQKVYATQVVPKTVQVTYANGLRIWDRPGKDAKKTSKKFDKGYILKKASAVIGVDGNNWCAYTSSITRKVRWFKLGSTDGKTKYTKCMY